MRQPHFVGARLDSKKMDVASRFQLDVLTRASKYEQTIAGCFSDRAKRKKGGLVPVVGCCRGQHDKCRAGCEPSDRGMAVARADSTVSFVDDDRVPGARQERREDFGTFDVID